MAQFLEPTAVWGAAVVEVLGVFIIGTTALYTLGLGAAGLIRREAGDALFSRIRQRLGRGILLGLEFLVAGDIIHTVAVDLTFKSVGVLGLVVLIRTFLSFTLEVELTGRWPWQKGKPSVS